MTKRAIMSIRHLSQIVSLSLFLGVFLVAGGLVLSASAFAEGGMQGSEQDVDIQNIPDVQDTQNTQDTQQDVQNVQDQSRDTYSEGEIAAEVSGFFGKAAKGMADAVHGVFSKYGEPNAYIKGEEASGAFILGLRYGNGELFMKNGERRKVFWQGPSAGWDFGGDAVKVFTLVYRLPNGDKIYQRFPGVEGSAYLVGGVGVNYQQREEVILAPMRAGAGLRLGASVGYLAYSRERSWFPF